MPRRLDVIKRCELKPRLYEINASVTLQSDYSASVFDIIANRTVCLLLFHFQPSQRLTLVYCWSFYFSCWIWSGSSEWFVLLGCPTCVKDFIFWCCPCRTISQAFQLPPIKISAERDLSTRHLAHPCLIFTGRVKSAKFGLDFRPYSLRAATVRMPSPPLKSGLRKSAKSSTAQPDIAVLCWNLTVLTRCMGLVT